MQHRPDVLWFILCVCMRARPCSRLHLLVCGRGAQTGSSSTETNQNTMRIHHNEAACVTDVPCALPISSFTPRGLRYRKTSMLATALHHLSKPHAAGAPHFPKGYYTFTPTEFTLLVFAVEQLADVRARSLITRHATTRKMRRKRS